MGEEGSNLQDDVDGEIQVDAVNWKKGARYSTSYARSQSTVLVSARADWRVWQVNVNSGMTLMPWWKPKKKP